MYLKDTRQQPCPSGLGWKKEDNSIAASIPTLRGVAFKGDGKGMIIW
jgi:hypothetical protein